VINNRIVHGAVYVHQDITETLHFSHRLLHLGRKDMRPCQLLDDIVLFRRKPQTEPGNDQATDINDTFYSDLEESFTRPLFSIC
jgi:hypothetical protein